MVTPTALGALGVRKTLHLQRIYPADGFVIVTNDKLIQPFGGDCRLMFFGLILKHTDYILCQHVCRLLVSMLTDLSIHLHTILLSDIKQDRRSEVGNTILVASCAMKIWK